MIYCFDIDGTICTKASHYKFAKPIQPMIDRINKLYENGNTIILSTARGKGSGVDYEELTRQQIFKWKVKHNEILFDKPSADFYVDDKAVLPETLYLKEYRQVFTNGCFDIIHAGHIKLLREASELGIVTVGVNSDDSVRRIKREPVNKLEDRMEVLSSIRYVDRVIPFTQDTPFDLVMQLLPDVIVKGADWKGKDVNEFKFVESYGGKVHFVELLTGYSSSKIMSSWEDRYTECLCDCEKEICGICSQPYCDHVNCKCREWNMR